MRLTGKGNISRWKRAYLQFCYKIFKNLEISKYMKLKEWARIRSVKHCRQWADFSYILLPSLH